MVTIIDALGIDVRSRHIQSSRNGPLGPRTCDICCIDGVFAVISGSQDAVYLLPEGIANPRLAIALGVALTRKDK